MTLQLPVLDDRNFDQLVEETQRRIPAFTPEWTNFGVESDPGITLVQLFAFLADSLLYSANRIPDRNRLKFLQLLGIPLQPATSAGGIITIRNDRGPVEALPLNPGVVVSAGNVDFLTLDGVNVLPLDAQVYYKHKILPTDPRYAQFNNEYQAIQAAKQAAADDDAASSANGGATIELAFYETMPMPAPTAGDPNPVVDLAQDTLDGALYIALLGPKNVLAGDVRAVIAGQTLSIGVVPALAGDVAPLLPRQPAQRPAPASSLLVERAQVQGDTPVPGWTRLTPVAGTDVLNAMGFLQVQLPAGDELRTWTFDDPLLAGTDDYPPPIDDEQIADRVITWIRLRVIPPDADSPGAVPSARFTWVGINATRVYQAVPIANELLGPATGEPDQTVTLANTPVLPASVKVIVQDAQGNGRQWRLVDDLLAAERDAEVFSLDPESGQVRFGALQSARPPFGGRILASYQYGGGLQGNVGLGAIKASRDVRLQGGYKIENPLPTSGGDLGESQAEAERNLPLVLRHRDRLVTQEDFHDVAMRTPGVDVGRVEVLPLFLPSSTTTDTAPGVVTVLVIPQFDAQQPLWPTPDRLFLKRVCDYLDPRRLVTTEVYVRGPEYVPIYISVGIQVRAGFFPDDVRKVASDRLQAYLSSLPPGGPTGQGWPLGKRLIKKDLEAVVTRVPGVDFVNSLQLGVRNLLDIPDEFDLTRLQLPRVAGLSIAEGQAEPLASVFGAVTLPTTPNIQVVPVPVTKSKC